MYTADGFDEFVKEIQALGYSAQEAERFAVLIGDTPEFDSEQRVVVRDEDRNELARLRLRF